MTLKEFMRASEEKFVRNTLVECDGKMGETADKLGIYRTVFTTLRHPFSMCFPNKKIARFTVKLNISTYDFSRIYNIYLGEYQGK